LNSSNEFQKFSFTWEDGIIAIFHTHPRGVDPRPSDGDMKVADKYRVLMFTLTHRGMYVYDPQTKKTSIVMYGVDWLDASNWSDELSMKMAALSPSFSSRLVANSSR
jgi:proteasome lid subunit RPN8/RPN11